MKFALTTVAIISMAAFSRATVTIPAGLATIYGYVCDSNTQNDASGTALYTNNSPFQFITGWALGG